MSDQIPSKVMVVNGDEVEVPQAVRLGGKVVPVSAPASLTIRYEILGLAHHNSTRGAGAALGACLRGPARPKVSLDQCGYNPAVFGGRVIDELAQVYPLAELMVAAAVCQTHLAAGLPDIKGGAVEADFSEAEGGSTS